jgi:hypothetical protein
MGFAGVISGGGLWGEGSASFFAKKAPRRGKQKNSCLLRVVAQLGQTPTVNRRFLVTFFQKSNGFLVFLNNI